MLLVVWALTAPMLARAQAQQFPEFVAVEVQRGDTLSSLAEKYLHDASKGWVIAEFNRLESVQPGQKLIIPLQPVLLGGLTPNQYQTVPVLLYDAFAATFHGRTVVPPDVFRSQMTYLRDQGFRPITIEQFIDFMNFRAQIPQKAVLITVDSAERDFYETAYPVLKELGFPATLFVYTEQIGTGGNALTWPQVKEMAANGIGCQCHPRTKEGIELTGVASIEEYFKRLQEELNVPRETLRRELGRPCEFLAYPAGDTNHLAIATARKLGYKGGFTQRQATNAFFYNDFRIFRTTAPAEFDPEKFRALLSTSANRVLQ